MISRSVEKEVAIAYLGGVPMREICDHYQIHRSTVHRIITRLGIDADRGKAAR